MATKRLRHRCIGARRHSPSNRDYVPLSGTDWWRLLGPYLLRFALMNQPASAAAFGVERQIELITRSAALEATPR